MTTFTKEQLIEQARANLTCHRTAINHPLAEVDAELFAIALASLEAEPVTLYRERNPYNGMATGWQELTQQEYEFVKDNASDNAEFRTVYTSPPAPVLPEELLSAMEEVLRISDRDHEAWHQARAGIVACRAAMQGKAVSQKVQPVMFIDGDISPADAEKLAAAIREFNSEPGEPSLMITEPVSNRDELPATMFKPVADLYGITSPTGSETTFTFDAVEARDFIDGGWSCQEYVKLERHQQAVVGNSPVIQDGWVACSERLPEWNDDVLCATEFDGPGDWRKKVGYWHDGKWVIYGGSWTPTHWMPLPAAPQQEAE